MRKPYFGRLGFRVGGFGLKGSFPMNTLLAPAGCVRLRDVGAEMLHGIAELQSLCTRGEK